MTNLNELKELQDLSPEERKIALEILKQYSLEGKSELYTRIINSDFDEIPVTIDVFIHDPRYLGRALTDNDGRFTIFPYWEKVLKDIFPDNIHTNYNTLIFTGAIGLGKSTIAVICMLYLFYRLLCLKDPYLYYGLQPIDKISLSFMNITLDNAKGVAMDKFNQMLLSSEWFLTHGEMTGSVNLKYVSNKHIEIIPASSNNHIIGRAIFASFEDEVNFQGVKDVERAKKKELKLIGQIDARMKSRFLRGDYLPTLNIIASSKDSDQSFLDSYITMKKEQESKSTLIIDEPQWVVDNRKVTDKWFTVGVGNKFLPNELLPLECTDTQKQLYINKGYTLIEVPIAYYEDFRTNIDNALADIAGISIANALKYISGERLVEIKSTNYENPFIQDIITVGTGDNTQYAQYFDLSKVPDEYKSRPLFVHLDMSIKGDKTGIAGTWIMSKKAGSSGENMDKEACFKAAFSVSVQAPQGREISFEKNRNFIRWLRDNGFNVKLVSSDTFQSAQILQQLQADGFKTQIISVDRLENVPGTNRKVCQPYAIFKSAIYEKRYELYAKCDLLTQEILGLEREADGHINHPENGKYGSKDQCDACCGSLYAASLNVEEFAYDYGETLETTLDSNQGDQADNTKKQINIDFEKQLQDMFDPMAKHNEKKPTEKTKDVTTQQTAKKKSQYLDFGMGEAKPYKPQFLKDGIIFW